MRLESDWVKLNSWILVTFDFSELQRLQTTGDDIFHID
jgi:hypothetical protein